MRVTEQQISRLNTTEASTAAVQETVLSIVALNIGNSLETTAVAPAKNPDHYPHFPYSDGVDGTLTAYLIKGTVWLKEVKETGFTGITLWKKCGTFQG